MDTLLKPVLRLILPMLVGYLATWALSFVENGICVGSHTQFCSEVWPQLVGYIVAALTYLRTHPNGLNGPPAPDAVSKVMSSMKVAPPPPEPGTTFTYQPLSSDERPVG